MMDVSAFFQNDPYFPALNTSSGRPHCIAFTRSLPGQQRLGTNKKIRNVVT